MACSPWASSRPRHFTAQKRIGEGVVVNERGDIIHSFLSTYKLTHTTAIIYCLANILRKNNYITELSPYMPALPKVVHLDPDGVSAWNLLLAAEDAALKRDSRPAKYLDELVGVRVLGFFLLDFYKHSNVHQIGLIPYKRLLREIISCFAVSVTDDEAQMKAVFDLGLSYRNHLMRVCE
jgi:hypothetical protein